ncbi:hypothetical protein NCC49_002716 [Naganishia albida]|nr:hypothetical protein NCC49_002716 [Naganishia albida]
MQGLSRRPPRAISVSKVGSTGDPIIPKGFSAESKILCHPIGPRAANLNLTFVESIDDRGYKLASRHVDLRNGGIEDEPPPAGLLKSVFNHLPLGRIRSEQDIVLSEDKDHYHTIIADLDVSAGWRITSTPKPIAPNVQCFYVPIVQGSGVLAMSSEEVEFSSDMEQYRSPASTRCPAALSDLLQSAAKLDHVVIRSTEKVVTLYILGLQGAGAPQLWRVQVLAYQSALAVQQVKHVAVETDASRQHDILQEEGVQLIRREGMAGGDRDELSLTYAGEGQVIRFDLLIQDGAFVFRHSRTTQILSGNLTSVVTNDSSDIATSQ